MTRRRDRGAPDRAARLLLALAAVAVAFAAADTYVVVLALPDMMAGVGLPVDQLQRAAPIVSGFLLGYVAMLPLIGRIADLRGRVPVLVGVARRLRARLAGHRRWPTTCRSMVTGRFLQGVGGGGLVPATLALVADLYPPERRGVPLGVVSARSRSSAASSARCTARWCWPSADWRAIFWINLAVGLVLAAADPAQRHGERARPETHRRAAGVRLARAGAARRSPPGAGAPGHASQPARLVDGPDLGRASSRSPATAAG